MSATLVFIINVKNRASQTYSKVYNYIWFDGIITQLSVSYYHTSYYHDHITVQVTIRSYNQ